MGNLEFFGFNELAQRRIKAKPAAPQSGSAQTAVSIDCSLDNLCVRILARHRDKIRAKKPYLAVSNLARIVKATLKLSNKQGFHATSLRDLASESGISMGGIYSYIDSKDTLLLMVLGEVITTATEVLESSPHDIKADPAAHLRWLIHAHIELTEQMLPWFVFSYMEAKTFPDAARNAAIDNEIAVERIFATTLKRGVDSGCFSIPDPDFTAALIKPLLQDWYVKRSKYRKRSISPHAYAEYVGDFVEAAIRS